jgi:hypothetical protein
MLSLLYVHYAECLHAECCYAECRGAAVILVIMFEFTH